MSAYPSLWGEEGPEGKREDRGGRKIAWLNREKGGEECEEDRVTR